jgi:hypothetical protein
MRRAQIEQSVSVADDINLALPESLTLDERFAQPSAWSCNTWNWSSRANNHALGAVPLSDPARWQDWQTAVRRVLSDDGVANPDHGVWRDRPEWPCVARSGLRSVLAHRRYGLVVLHELCVNGEGEQTFCLLGPRGEDVRRIVGPTARLVWTVEALSHFDAMTKYYEHMGSGKYTTDYREWDGVSTPTTDGSSCADRSIARLGRIQVLGRLWGP